MPLPRAHGRPTGLVTLGLLTLVGCSDDATAPDVRQLVLTPPAGLAVGVGGSVRFAVEAFGADGVPVASDGSVWTSGDPDVATVGQDGVARAVAEGFTEISVRLGQATASAALEVYVPDPVVGDYQADVSYFGRREYIEYLPGTLPVILSAPHGGRLTPDEIANRSQGVRVRDTNTLELTLAVRDALVSLTGASPHVVVSHLDRVKLDPNREALEAAQGDPFAEQAWREYHAFIEEARSKVGDFGGGMYFDLHGHGHARNRLELGYLIGADVLNQPDRLLNSLSVVQMTSIRELGRDAPIPFSEMLRGPTSFGGLMEAQGVAAVPAPADPSPGSDPYFSGGYSTRRHGSIADSEVVSGIQIEHHYTGIRDTEVNRLAYADRLARAIQAFMLEHFGYFEP